jgi:hypothetical protein
MLGLAASARSSAHMDPAQQLRERPQLARSAIEHPRRSGARDLTIAIAIRALGIRACGDSANVGRDRGHVR